MKLLARLDAAWAAGVDKLFYMLGISHPHTPACQHGWSYDNNYICQTDCKKEDCK